MADNYGESDDVYIPTGWSVIETTLLKLESADSSADSNADPPKIDVWVPAFK